MGEIQPDARSLCLRVLQRKVTYTKCRAILNAFNLHWKNASKTSLHHTRKNPTHTHAAIPSRFCRWKGWNKQLDGCRHLLRWHHEPCKRKMGMRWTLKPYLVNTTGSEIIDDLLLAHITNIKIWYPPQNLYFLRIYWYLRVLLFFFRCLNVWIFGRLFLVWENVQSRVVSKDRSLIKRGMVEIKNNLVNKKKCINRSVVSKKRLKRKSWIKEGEFDWRTKRLFGSKKRKSWIQIENLFLTGWFHSAEKMFHERVIKKNQKKCFDRNSRKPTKIKLFGKVRVSGPKIFVLVSSSCLLFGLDLGTKTKKTLRFLVFEGLLKNLSKTKKDLSFLVCLPYILQGRIFHKTRKKKYVFLRFF